MTSTKVPEIVKLLSLYKDNPNIIQLSDQKCDVVMPTYYAGEAYDTHIHETHNCGVITSGEMVLTIENECKRYGVGEWYDIPPRAEHSSYFDVDTTSVELYFYPAET